MELLFHFFLKVLINYGADATVESLQPAASLGHLAIVEVRCCLKLCLVLKPENLILQSFHSVAICSINISIRLLLHLIAKFLIKHGADIHATTSGAMTPLMCASANGQLDVVSYLIARGNTQQRYTLPNKLTIKKYYSEYFWICWCSLYCQFGQLESYSILFTTRNILYVWTAKKFRGILICWVKTRHFTINYWLNSQKLYP